MEENEDFEIIEVQPVLQGRRECGNGSCPKKSNKLYHVFLMGSDATTGACADCLVPLLEVVSNQKSSYHLMGSQCDMPGTAWWIHNDDPSISRCVIV